MVLQAVGYDPEKYGGFAAGFGVERFAMIMHNIQVLFKQGLSIPTVL